MQQLPTFGFEELRTLVPELEHVDESVDVGGQKSVYHCLIEGREWALKLIDAAETPVQAVERARREVAIIEKCSSPYLVKPGPVPFGQGAVGGVSVVYFTEEWVGGDNLANIVRENGPLGSAEVCKLGKQMTSGIDALSRMGCVHRDIKPLNIMRRQPSGDYVLLDLGFALILDRSSLTPTGAVVGTARYFSPEQIVPTSRPLDCRSDLFSLGIVLYEAATGVHPFAVPGMAPDEIWRAILTTRPAPLAEVALEIPTWLGTLVMRLLEKQPHMRFRTCGQVMAALDSGEP